jgi:hypothetical protein
MLHNLSGSGVTRDRIIGIMSQRRMIQMIQVIQVSTRFYTSSCTPTQIEASCLTQIQYLHTYLVTNIATATHCFPRQVKASLLTP